MSDSNIPTPPAPMPNPVVPAPVPKKKCGFLGKLLILLLGIIIGVVGTFGSVFMLAYSVPANDVAKLAGIDLNDYLEKEYAEKTILGMFGAVGTAVSGVANGSATLQNFDDISPKVGEGVEKLTSTMSNDYGIKITNDGMMNTPLNEMAGYLKDSILNSYACDLLSNALDVTDSAFLMGMCYGQKGVDYYLDDNGEPKMMGDSLPRTINDLSKLGNGIFDDVPLADMMSINHDDTLMMYIGYGKKDIHYDLDDNNEVVHLRKRIAVYDKTPYNEYGELLSGTLNGTTSYTEDETTYLLVSDSELGTLKTKDGNVATLYYLNDSENNELYYHSTTLGDLLNDATLIGNITSRLTIGDILGEEATSDNKFLKHVADVTVDHLSDAIENLTVVEVFDSEVFVTDEANENFLDKDGNPTTNPDEYVVHSEWWYLLHSEANTECNGSHADGPCKKSCITDYKVTEMDSLITNMRENIEASSLNKLKKDGMIDALDEDTLIQPIRPDIKGIVDIDMTGIDTTKKTLGELTVEEMLHYVSAMFAAMDKLENLDAA